MAREPVILYCPICGLEVKKIREDEDELGRYVEYWCPVHGRLHFRYREAPPSRRRRGQPRICGICARRGGSSPGSATSSRGSRRPSPR